MTLRLVCPHHITQIRMQLRGNLFLEQTSQTSMCSLAFSHKYHVQQKVKSALTDTRGVIWRAVYITIYAALKSPFVRVVTTHSSCITLLWLHHNHKMSISYHKNGLVSSHQSVGRWFIFYVLCSEHVLMKLVGYQQLTCLRVKKEFVVGTISLSCELYLLLWNQARNQGGRRGNCNAKILNLVIFFRSSEFFL